MFLRLNLDKPAVLILGSSVGLDRDGETAAIAQVALDIGALRQRSDRHLVDIVMIMTIDEVEQTTNHVVVVDQVLNTAGDAALGLALVTAKI